MDVHDVTELFAIITTDVVDDEFPNGGHLLIQVWRDLSMRVVFASGSEIDAKARPGMDFNALINTAIALIHQCCQDAGREDPPQITVHRVPVGLTSAEQILAWIQSVPGIALSFKRPAGRGLGGPIPPAGQAG